MLPNTIQAHLARLGLTKKDTTVYMAVIRLGLARASEISAEVSLPRQTVYSILHNLVRRQLIEQYDRRGIRHFSGDLRALLRRIRTEQEKLQQEEAALAQEIAQIQTIKHRPASLPVLHYYEDREGLKKLFSDILVQNKAGEKKMSGYGVNSYQKTMGEYFYSFIKKRAALGVKTRLLIAEGPDDLSLTGPTDAYNRSVKRLRMDEQHAGCYIIGDRVYFFSYFDNVGFVVENRAIAKLLQAVFDDHWQRV
jgi:HTH-type transcriptional regulator, sugar sensing transcriptional regulator